MHKPPNRELRLLIGPNASLSGRQALAFFATISTVSLAIAGFWAWQGFWPILPLAGLELAALALALWVSLRGNKYRELIRISDERVRVEFGVLGAGPQAHCDLNRAGTRALLEAGANRHSPTRLLLSCNGQIVEVGRCLTDEERSALCLRIKQALHPGWLSRPGSSAGADPALN